MKTIEPATAAAGSATAKHRRAAGSRISVDFPRKDEIGKCSGDGAGYWVGEVVRMP
jgi:hypothetical protein